MDRGELERGLRRTSRYLLSHHEPEEHHRCYHLKAAGRSVRLCARCLGIYAGLGAAIVFQGFLSSAGPILIFAMAFPTIVEKYLTGVRDFKGHNSVRTATGFLLGAAYAKGLMKVLSGDFSLMLIAVAAFMSVAAVWLAAAEQSRK